MADVLVTCRAAWKRLGVPAAARADLESELVADLAEAAADGVDASRFVGGDAAGFAREWALARGLVRARWHVLGCVVVAGVVGFGALMVVDLIARPAWLYQAFGQQRLSAGSWLALYGADVALDFLTPVLAAVAVYLAVVRDGLVARTVVVVLITSPITIWASGELAAWLVGPPGTGWGALFFAGLFALGVGSLRAVVVAISRRAGTAADIEVGPPRPL